MVFLLFQQRYNLKLYFNLSYFQSNSSRRIALCYMGGGFHDLLRKIACCRSPLSTLAYFQAVQVYSYCKRSYVDFNVRYIG